ncbi:hypothetical protein BH09MYX1_BH09MYX1_06960 [soil metagenome]
MAKVADFPSFLKSSRNRIATASQFTDGVEGFVFDGEDGSQVAFWTSTADRVSKPHAHAFDEYVLVIEGRATIIIGEQKTELGPGAEHVIPKGTLQSMAVVAGTRTMHVFGGKRVKRENATGALTQIVIPCTDLQKSRDFYAALGLELTREQHEGGPVHFSSSMSGVLLQLYPAKLVGAPTRIGLRVASVSAATAATTKAGGTLRYVAVDSPKAVVLDPDDHAIELSE